MDRRHAAGALLALAVCIASSDAAPTASNQTALDLYDGAAEGCYYNFQHYGEGDRIMTNEPCLNCTCHNRMLMCYLRVCPFTKPIGQDCSVEKRADQCCPIVTCPDVPVDLLTSTSTTSPAEYGATGVGKLDKYGCSIDGKYFPEGSKVPPTPNKPCEHCYCIRNMTTCVMQECTLHVDGCTPIYHKDVCCPVRYSCDHAEDEIPLLDDMTTTVRPTPGFLLTITTVSPVTQMSQDCVHDDQIVPDGALIKTEKACEHCYCMKGDIVCVVQECGTPMENEGKNCTSQPPREGQCCPDTYICEGDEATTDLLSEITTQPSILEDVTTISPPRRAEGSDYRKETDETYTEKSPFTESEGSGYEQTSISSFDNSATTTTDDQGSGYEHSNLLTEDFITDREDSENEYTTPLSIGVSDEKTTEPHEILYERTTQKLSIDYSTTQHEGEFEPETSSITNIEESTSQKHDIKHDHTILPVIGVSDKETTEQQESTTTTRTSITDDTTSKILDSKHEYTIPPNIIVSSKETTEQEDEHSTTPRIIVTDESTSEKHDSEQEYTIPPSSGISDKETTQKQDDDYEHSSTTSSVVSNEITSEKQDGEHEHTITPSKETTQQQESASITPSSTVANEVSSDKHGSEEEYSITPGIEVSDKETTEKQESEYDRTTTAGESTSDKHDIDIEHTISPIIGAMDKETTERQEGDYDRSTIVVENASEKDDSDYEHTVSPIMEISDKATTEHDGSDYERTTTSKTSIAEESSSEKHDSDQETLPPSMGISDKETTERHETEDERTTTSKTSLVDDSTSESDESKYKHTTIPSDIDSSDESAEPHSDHKLTTPPRITGEDTSDKEENKYEQTTLPSIGVFNDDDSGKQDIEDKITTLSSDDFSVKETTERSEDEKTTSASFDVFSKDTSDLEHDSTTLPSTDISDHTTSPKFGVSDKDILQSTEIEQEHTKSPSVSITDEATTQKLDSEYELTTVPYIQTSDGSTKGTENIDYEHSTPSKIETPEDVTTKKPRDDEESTTLSSINVSAKETSEKQDDGEKGTTVPSTEDFRKDTPGMEESDYKDTTLSSTIIFDKDVTEKQGSRDEITTLPSIGDANKDLSKKDENEITTLPSPGVSDKDITEYDTEKERTTLPSISDSDGDITEKQGASFESTALPSTGDISEKQESDYERTTPSSITTSRTEIEHEHSTLPTVDVSDDLTATKETKYDHSSTISITDIDTSEKQSTDSTKETTNEPLLYITSTAKISTLDAVQITTEPDKDLNTVPNEEIDVDISKPLTTEKTSMFVDEKVTEHALNSVDITYQSTQTNLEEVTDLVDNTPITEGKLPFDEEVEMKVTTEIAQKLDMTTTVKTFITETSTTDDSANQVTNYSRIPGEGDCLLNGITYKNNSEVPKSNNCHTSCKCMSSIIKCDPIMCSPPPKYMDNCQPIYDTPDSCCPTYICQTRETMPPQPDNHISVTDQPSTSSEHECKGEKCEESHDKGSPDVSKKPVIDDCGPSGCGDMISPDCGNNECSPPISVIPAQPCQGDNCNIEPIIVPVQNVPLCQNGQDCQQESSCIGNSCLNVDGTDVFAPSKDESCKDSKDCHKQEDDISSQCTDESCRRKDTGKLEGESPTVCSGSECVQGKPVPEIDNNKIITSSESPTQEKATELYEQTTFAKEDLSTDTQDLQTKYPETKTTSVVDLEQSTTKSEISNELPTSETKPSSEILETPDITTRPSNVAFEEMSTTFASEVVTTIPTDSSVTQGTEQKETVDVQETALGEKVTKSPEETLIHEQSSTESPDLSITTNKEMEETLGGKVTKSPEETLIQEQSSTESPDLLITTNKEIEENDVQAYITKLPTVKPQTELQGPSVTDSQDVTTKSDEEVNVKTEITHFTKEITTVTSNVIEIQRTTTVAPVDIYTDTSNKDKSELPDIYTTITEDDQRTDIPTKPPKSEIEDDSIISTTQSVDEYMTKEPVYTTLGSIDQSSSIDTVSTENEKEQPSKTTQITKDSEFNVQASTTETSKFELSTEADLHSVTETQVTSLQDEKNIKEEMPSSEVTLVSEDLSETTSKITQPPDDKTTYITNEEESVITEASATISPSETNTKDIETTKQSVTEQSIRVTPETITTSEQETEVQLIEKDTESSVVDQDKAQTETPVSAVLGSEATSPSVPSLNENQVTIKPFATTDTNEVETTQKVAEEHITEKDIITENTAKPLPDEVKTTEYIVETPVTQESNIAETEPHKVTTDIIVETEKHEITTHGVMTEEKYDVETTTVMHEISEDGKISESTEVPSKTTLMEAEELIEITDEYSVQTDLPEVSYTGSQDKVTKIQDELKPETVTQSLQTESPTIPSFIDHTDSSISQTTESAEYNTKEEVNLPDSTKSQEEKLTTFAIIDEKETATTETSNLGTKVHDQTTKLLQTSTTSAVYEASTQFDVTTQSDINVEETMPDVTEPDVILATNIPEPHKKDQQQVTAQTESTEVQEEETSTPQAESTKQPYTVSSKLPYETTTHIIQEKDTEISPILDISTRAPVDTTMEHDKEMTKEPIKLTTEHALEETSVYSQDKETENIQEFMTTIPQEVYVHEITRLPQDTSTKLPTVADKDIKETTTEKHFYTKIEYTDDTTQKPSDIVTESIRDITTIAIDETSDKGVEIPSPHDSAEKGDLEPSKTQQPNTDLLLEKTTEKLDIATGTSQEMLTIGLFDKELSTTPSELSTESLGDDGDINKSKEPEVTTESYVLKETTPYEVELEEHTHKSVDDITTILFTEQESTTHLPESYEDESTEKEFKSPEPISTSSPLIQDTSITTLTSDNIEKSTLSSLSIDEHEPQSTKTPDASEDENDIEASSPLQTQSTPAHEQSPITDAIIPVQTEKVPITESSQETESSDKDTTSISKDTTQKIDVDITTTPSIFKPDKKPAETLPPTKLATTSKPEIDDILPTEEIPDDDSPFPQYNPDLPDYGEEPFGPGTCRYGGKVYVSAQQIPRDDPCDFCFCFRSDIICLQQSCPPPIHGCYEEPIQGFCCPRYECPVAMATTLNVTTTTTTTTTTLPPHFLPHAYKGAAHKRGCQIKGHTYKVGEVVRASSGPCLHCTCGGDGQMKCDPKACTPEPMLRQMIAAAVSAKRRR